jgi:hypothetical protein
MREIRIRRKENKKIVVDGSLLERTLSILYENIFNYVFIIFTPLKRRKMKTKLGGT